MNRPTPSWLEKAGFYEIYPQTFYDSNGDGIGDIPGILQKLDYLVSLGVTAVWLNPCFVSPFGDTGYDVADYYQVAPRYGSNEDLKNLFVEAKQRGIRFLLDLVPGHTSIECKWFKASCKQERNEYSDWYIWTDTVWTPPTEGQQNVCGYTERNAAGEDLWVVLNPSGRPVDTKLPAGLLSKEPETLYGQPGIFTQQGSAWPVRLPPVSGVIYKI